MNPLAVEQQYQALLQSLPLIASRRNRLYVLSEFLYPLLQPDHRTLLRAYGPECIPLFLEQLSDTQLRGVLPSFHQRLRNILTQLQVSSFAAADPAAWTSAELALANGESDLREILRKKSSESVLTAVHESRGGPADTSISIPVVEQEILIHHSELVFAALRHVRVDIQFSDRSTGEDEVLIDQAFDVDGVQHRQMRMAVRVAKRLLKTFSGINVERRVIVHCSLDEPNIVVGESLGVGLTFAVFTEFLRLMQPRELVLPRPDVALTGVVSSDGEILPVDIAGLRRKIEACAYDRIRVLAVPRSQEEIAEGLLREIAVTEPIPPVLTIIGVAHLEDVLFDRRLTIVHQTSFVRFVLQKTRRYRTAAIIATSVVALSAAAQLWLGPVDKNPVIGEFSQESLVLLNGSGEHLRQIVVGADVVRLNDDALAARRNCRMLALVDADDDGMNDVLYLRATPDGGGWNELCCQSGKTQELLWTSRISKNFSFGVDSKVMEYRFFISGLLVDDLDRDGEQEVVVLASLRAFYPSMLIVLRARDGNEQGSYLHLGRLNDIAIVDIDNDSTREIVACGINNAFRSATLAVFEYPRISGSSPSVAELKPREWTPGQEEYYLQIPRSIVGESFRSQNFGNMATRLGVVRGKSLDVGIKDFEEFVPELGQRVEGMVTLTFGQNFAITRIERNESYDLTGEILFRKNWIDRLPDDRYFAVYSKELQYWNGQKWVSKTPVVNSFFGSPR